jgi:hypothetical protein
MPLNTRIEIRAQGALQEALVRAAVHSQTSASEYARQAISERLKADGFAPADGYALTLHGELVRDTEGCAETVGREHGTPEGYRGCFPDGCKWLPIFNVDSEPFDAKLHYRATPPTLRVNGDHVQRVYRVIRKEDDR